MSKRHQALRKPAQPEPGTAPKQGAERPSSIPSPKAHPRTWDEIGVGSLVLATIGVEDGWWEAVVERVEGELLTLRWRDWPKEPRFVRRRKQLALLPVGSP